MMEGRKSVAFDRLDEDLGFFNREDYYHGGSLLCLFLVCNVIGDELV